MSFRSCFRKYRVKLRQALIHSVYNNIKQEINGGSSANLETDRYVNEGSRSFFFFF